MKKSPHTPSSIALRTLLIEKRKHRQLLQSDVAKRLKKPQSYISKYENGEKKIDLIDFIDICSALSIDPIKTFEEYIASLKTKNHA